MKLTMTKVLTPIAALAFSFGVQAAAVSTDGFETETTTVVTNRTGWSFTYGTDGADDASAITAYGESATPTSVPEGMTYGSNYLKLSTEDGVLFRTLDPSAQDGAVNLNSGSLFVDTDVQFTVTDASDSPTNTVDAADKFVIWLEAGENNGVAYTNLSVLGHSFGATVADRTDKVYTLAPEDGGTLSIVPGEWHRLTVKAVSSCAVDGETFTYPAFQVYLDETPLVANEYIGDAATLNIGQIASFKPYIPARATSLTSLSKVGFSGEGAIDSVVVTKEEPGFTNPLELTFEWDDNAPFTSVYLSTLDLTLTSTGTVRVASSLVGQTIPLVIAGTNLENYDVKIDDVVVANPAEASITGANKKYRITATAKDTVRVEFTIDADSWLVEVGGSALYTYIQSVMVGDENITATVVAGDTANIPLKVGTNVTVAVTLSSPVAAVSLAPSGATELTISGFNVTVDSFGDGAAGIAIVANTPKAFVNGQPCATLAEALSAANAAGTATILLADDVTIGNVAIADGKNITIDLAGNDITGAANGAAVFAVADGGTLTITNSTVDVGIVSKGDATACISNAGTLNLQAGKFDIADGAISGGTINVTGGAFNAATFAGATLPADKKIASTSASDEYVYVLVDKVYINSITLDKNTLELTVGDAAVTLTATYTASEDDSVEWTTSDATVATVANGVVTPVAAGTATITVAAANGTGTASCTVTVKAASAGWVDDSGTIEAGTTAATQYPDLVDSALASADAKKLTDWAAAKSVAYADVVAAPANYVEAFLLNCAPAAEAVAAEKVAFKADITVNADGTVTVTPPAGKTYNVTPQLKGATSLTGTWTAIETTTGYNFFKYELSLPAAGN